jgi:hypothetical protein
MRTFSLLLPTGLSLLLLAAHFLRRGAMFGMLLCLVLFALMWVRRPWVVWALRGVLIASTLEWWHTLATTAAERREAGEPWLRMAIILGAVIAVALLGAVLLEAPALRRRFGRGGG